MQFCCSLTFFVIDSIINFLLIPVPRHIYFPIYFYFQSLSLNYSIYYQYLVIDLTLRSVSYLPICLFLRCSFSFALPFCLPVCQQICLCIYMSIASFVHLFSFSPLLLLLPYPHLPFYPSTLFH